MNSTTSGIVTPPDKRRRMIETGGLARTIGAIYMVVVPSLPPDHADQWLTLRHDRRIPPLAKAFEIL
jgi:hypothetical protein